jgi:hypothetical protein
VIAFDPDDVLVDTYSLLSGPLQLFNDVLQNSCLLNMGLSNFSLAIKPFRLLLQPVHVTRVHVLVHRQPLNLMMQLVPFLHGFSVREE